MFYMTCNEYSRNTVKCVKSFSPMDTSKPEAKNKPKIDEIVSIFLVH